jgi:uncharacterized protein
LWLAAIKPFERVKDPESLTSQVCFVSAEPIQSPQRAQKHGAKNGSWQARVAQQLGNLIWTSRQENLSNTADAKKASLIRLRFKRTLDSAFRVGRSQEPPHPRRTGFWLRICCSHLPGPTLERQDDRRDYGEIRVQAIGQVSNDILFVVYTDRDDIGHIISAGLANRKERRLWQSFAEQWKTSAE